MKTGMKQSSRILELDGLRTLAISAVLLIHFSPHSKLFEMGWVGVDLFFVISGFLITGILLNLRSDSHAYRKFYWRRMIRIFPPYYAVLALVAILAFVHHEGFDRSTWLRVLFFLPAIKVGISFHLIFHRLMGAGFDLSHKLFVPRGLFEVQLRAWSLLVSRGGGIVLSPVGARGAQRFPATDCGVCGRPSFCLSDSSWACAHG